MDMLEKYGPLVGRVLIALIFVLSGFSKFTDTAGTAGYIASKGLPIASVLAVVAGVVEIAGAASVIVGFKTRWGALLLAAYLIPVTLIFHNPAGLEGMAAQMAKVEFMKNLAIFGGLLAIAALGPGPLSLDARRPARRLEQSA
jgi:putative oxidoreductase